jgi:hypothetical protein
MNNQIENIVNYCRTVLGLERIVLPALTRAALAQDESLAETQGLEIRGSLHGARLVALVPLHAEEFPLRGEAEALLEKMLQAMKLARSQVVLASWQYGEELTIPDEIAQLAAGAGTRPILVFGGLTAAKRMNQGEALGQWGVWSESRILTTFSPRELLRSPGQKHLAWVHLQAVMKHL